MGEYAPATITFYQCPAQHQLSVIDMLQEAGFVEEDYSTRDIEAPLKLNHPYVGEVRLDVCSDLGPALSKLEVTFKLYRDPKYEWDGDIYIHVASLGAFMGWCDSNGVIHILAAEVDRILAECDSLETLTAALADASGKRFRDALGLMSATGRPA